MEVRMAGGEIPVGRLLFTVQTAQGVHAVHHQAVVIVDAGQRLPRTQTVEMRALMVKVSFSRRRVSPS